MIQDIQRPLVGLITYHAAYNFGSSLQAYGTVRTIEDLGYRVETIDYRTPSQTFWYQTDFTRKKGIHSLIDNFGFKYKVAKERKIRAQKFEDFIKDFLHPTSERFTSSEEFKDFGSQYDYLVSGSDQIWNRSCFEFIYEEDKAMDPYFLKFGNPKKRIAFSSSFSIQPIRTVAKYRDELLRYDFLSTREPIMREYMERVIGREVELVCDPTWLLDKEKWLSLPGIYRPKFERPYLFAYLLYWDYRVLKRWLPAIQALADRNGWDVVCISPMNYHSDQRIKMIQDAGPLDFLSLLANAAMVVTNTFHGTIFSMNFEIPFFSCEVNPGSRQGQMLRLCNLEERSVNSPSELAEATDLTVDFTESTQHIRDLRETSVRYLRKALDSESN